MPFVQSKMSLFEPTNLKSNNQSTTMYNLNEQYILYVERKMAQITLSYTVCQTECSHMYVYLDKINDMSILLSNITQFKNSMEYLLF